LLMLVPGRLGGPVGGPALPLLALLLIARAGGAPNPPPPIGGDIFSPMSCDAPSISDDLDAVRCGGPDERRGAEVKFAPGGPLTARGGPALGGGGVADGVGVFSAPAFLLIQRF